MGVRRTRRSVLAGLALAAALAAGNATAAETRLTFSLDAPFRGPAAPFLLPLDNGGYIAEGLNVSVEAATDYMEPITRVATGAADMGFADINALIRYRDANPKAAVKAVFMVYNRPAYAIIARKSRGIATPKDLEGKKVGAPAADPAAAQWPVFAQANAIDTGKVTIENVGMPVREPMLAAGQIDAITGLTYRSYINLKDRGVPLDDIVVMQMADHGVALYGNAIIVNPKFASENPDAVRSFLRAYMKGLKETLRRPARAVDSVLKREEGLKRATEIDRLASVIHENIVTPEVRVNGFGGIDLARFTRGIEQTAQVYKFKNDKPKPEDIFDTSFLPAETERRYP